MNFAMLYANTSINLNTHRFHEMRRRLKHKNIKIIDTRKPFEHEVGTFKGAEKPNIKNFRDFPKYFQNFEKKNKNCNVLYWRY